MSDTNIRARLLRACYSFMVPVARFLLRSGIGFSEFAEVSRMAFVEAATRDYGIRGRPTNISRVAAMTGIGRKEVSRLRRAKLEYAVTPNVELSPLGDILHRWFTDKAYLDAKGRPKLLPSRGRRVSFTSLVRDCTRDLPVGAIKFELVRCGAVSEDSRGRLRANRRAVIPADQDEKTISSMAFNLRALASTIAFNATFPHLDRDGRIERNFTSDGLTEQVIRAYHPILRERIERFITDLDDTFSGVKGNALGVGRRVGVGVFYFEDD